MRAAPKSGIMRAERNDTKASAEGRKKEKGRTMRRKLPWMLLALFAALTLVGLLLGEYRTVLEKAVTVCLECVGIG
jgi:hypothetical protein